MKEFLDNQLVIINPMTGLNSGKSTYRIAEVAQYFGFLVESLNYAKMKFDKNYLPKDANIIQELLSQHAK